MSKTYNSDKLGPVTIPEPDKQGHTPGPWQFVGYFDAVEVSASDKSIAAWDGADWEIDSELEANARLIAAAPDLLAIAQEIANAGSECDLGDSERRIRLYAAITKAGADL